MDDNEFFDTHFIVSEGGGDARRVVLTVSRLPSHIQVGDVLQCVSPSGQVRGANMRARLIAYACWLTFLLIVIVGLVWLTLESYLKTYPVIGGVLVGCSVGVLGIFGFQKIDHLANGRLKVVPPRACVQER